MRAHGWCRAMVAGLLKVFDLVGLGEPVWYVGGVKLMFCAISLLIPVGMYFFCAAAFWGDVGAGRTIGWCVLV